MFMRQFRKESKRLDEKGVKLVAINPDAGEEAEARLEWRIGEPTRARHVSLELSEKPPEGVAPLANVGEARYLRALPGAFPTLEGDEQTLRHWGSIAALLDPV